MDRADFVEQETRDPGNLLRARMTVLRMELRVQWISRKLRNSDDRHAKCDEMLHKELFEIRIEAGSWPEKNNEFAIEPILISVPRCLENPCRHHNRFFVRFNTKH